jgi:hypothetical protein
VVALSTGDVTFGLGRPSDRNRHYANIDNHKNEYKLETVYLRQGICIDHLQETVFELLIGDVTSGLARSLADKIAITPKSTIEKADKTVEWCELDRKCVWNTNRKPWSNYRMAT